MKIILKDQYKSLHAFESDSLGSLSVITGKNGSGKTQLLELISKKAINDLSVIAIDFRFSPEKHKIQSEGLEKGDVFKIGNAQWKEIVDIKIEIYQKYTVAGKKLFRYLMANGILKEAYASIDTQRFHSKELKYLDLSYKALLESFPSHEGTKEKYSYALEDLMLKVLKKNYDSRIFEFVDRLCDKTGKIEDQLEEGDYYSTPIDENLFDTNDLFSSQIEVIFYNYAKRRDINRREYFDKKEDGAINDSISDSKFIEVNKPPWELINEIFDRHDINFQFEGVKRNGFSPDAEIEFKLTKKITGDVISFEHLSSGEKVIIGLIVKLFASEYYGGTLSFPELLILDEPDAHLHPEMSKLLLDVLEGTFVNQYSISVILTTHSPSTIALAPENSIYRLTNGKESGLSKISKDDALKLLTSFIPTLSIDYSNHRQVFVESPTDVTYYQNVHDIHQQAKDLKHKLYFISNAMGKGNCDLVYETVKNIRVSGNKTAFGIVDYDSKNKDADYVYVHGKLERYAIENFLMDPIYIICLLLNMKNADNIFSLLGLKDTYNEFSIGNEPSETLQNFTIKFFEKFEEKFPFYKYADEKVPVEYLNGRIIEIPKWYLGMEAHSIEGKLREIFVSFEKFGKKELEKELSLVIAKCYPFVPSATINVLERISDA